MNKPISIKIENETIYLAEEIYNYDKAFFNGCSRVRLIVEKKNKKKQVEIYI
jgi:hypothetical protein